MFDADLQSRTGRRYTKSMNDHKRQVKHDTSAFSHNHIFDELLLHLTACLGSSKHLYMAPNVSISP